MVQLPEIETTVSRIYKAYENKQRDSPPRPHLGASQIGVECEKAIWYGFRWARRNTFDGRMLRLFETGQLEEDRLVNNLKAAGVEIYPFDLTTGRQFSFKLFGGHYGGSLDGIAKGFIEAPETWHLVEFKTHNAKSFKSMLDKGVRESKPTHFFQMQSYMGMSHEAGQDDLPKLERAFYMAKNKDTDELYAERIEYDVNVYKHIKRKAHRIIFTANAPARIATKPSAFACKWCDYHDLCWGVNEAENEELIPPEVNCRTCCHSTAKEDGTWECEKHHRTLMNVDEQVLGCGKHLYLPYLLPWKIVDADPALNVVAYTKDDGTRVLNKGGGRLEEWKTKD